jgi:hypothetical protein
MKESADADDSLVAGSLPFGNLHSRPSASKPFDLLCQILPEEWLIERIQQVGANSCKPLSPSFVVIYRGIAAVFCGLRDIFVTDAITS